MTQRSYDLNDYTVFFQGRPCEISGNELIISSENGKHQVSIPLKEMEHIPPDEMEDRMVLPMLNNLDGITFPDRMRRAMAAAKAQANKFIMLGNSHSA